MSRASKMRSTAGSDSTREGRERATDGATHRRIELIGDETPNVIRLEHLVERWHLVLLPGQHGQLSG